MNSLSSKGFTLIEILVVMIIIAILSGAAVMSIRNTNHDRLVEEANRFNGLVLLAKDEALFQSKAVGIGFSKKGYTFFLEGDEDPDAWESFNDKPFISHLYFSGLVPDIIVDNRPLSLPETIAHPDIMLSPDGEVTPFEVHLAYFGEESVVLKYNSLGQPVVDSD